ncbi:tetratricopeptide repeat protein [Sporosalibacterium faouarense]|uniref:tetratricopeptide repeat protein n=1 Tax=Sporosalibacterium faouarense TaxID=516123 RepID=UPI00192AA659|nr:tetratricopeptide repeat protein [Sporosalibacterium faouarense]
MDNNKIIELFKDEQYEEIQEILDKEDNNNPWYYLFIGYLHEQKNFNEFSLLKARQYYQEGTKLDDTIPQLFSFLAELEMKTEDSIIILKKGLMKHSKSERLAVQLLNISECAEYPQLLDKTININKLSTNEEIIPMLLVEYFKNNCFEEIIEVDKKTNLTEYKFGDKFVSASIIAYSYFEKKQYSKAYEIFKHIKKYDAKNIMNYFSDIGLILSSINLNLLDELKLLIDQLPYSLSDYPINWVNTYISFDKYFELFLTKEIELIKNDKPRYAKLRGIKGLRHHEYGTGSCISDIKFALKNYGKKPEYLYALSLEYENKSDYNKAYKFGFDYLLSIGNVEKSYISFYYFTDMEENEFYKLYSRIKNDINNNLWNKELFITTIVVSVVERLFKDKKYDEVISFSSKFSFEQLKNEIGFELAYSLNELKDKKTAKQYYEYLVSLDNTSCAVYNNLGVIYKEEGKFELAIELFTKALNISPDEDLYLRNLKNAKNLLEKRLKRYKNEEKAIEQYKKENAWIKRILMNFFMYQDEQGYIECSYKMLPKYLSLTESKAIEVMNNFLDKKYIYKLKRDEHNLDTMSTVYQFNSLVREELEQSQLETSIYNEIYDSVSGFTVNAYEEMGYNVELKKKIGSIKNSDFKIMIERDVRENFVAIMSKSWKSSLVLSGSIIEALVMDKLRECNIKKYDVQFRDKSKSKKVETMGLNELLFVAKEERLMTHELYHHSQAIRGYRNLVHPAVEERKSKDTPQVTEHNAKLAWDVMRKVIKEL